MEKMVLLLKKYETVWNILLKATAKEFNLKCLDGANYSLQKHMHVTCHSQTIATEWRLS